MKPEEQVYKKNGIFSRLTFFKFLTQSTLGPFRFAKYKLNGTDALFLVACSNHHGTHHSFSKYFHLLITPIEEFITLIG